MTNSEKIRDLERQTVILDQELKAYSTQLQGIIAQLEDGADTAKQHVKSIAILEERIQIVVDVKSALNEITAIRLKLTALEKDIESLKSWKEDQKKEHDELKRRWWSFGPAIVSAFISAAVALAITFLKSYLDKPK